MHLLFALDGTLVDSFPGISRSINQTLTTSLLFTGPIEVSAAVTRPTSFALRSTSQALTRAIR